MDQVLEPFCGGRKMNMVVIKQTLWVVKQTAPSLSEPIVHIMRHFCKKTEVKAGFSQKKVVKCGHMITGQSKVKIRDTFLAAVSVTKHIIL